MDANEVLIGYLNDCYDIHDAKIERDLMITREERYHFAVHSTGVNKHLNGATCQHQHGATENATN